MRIEKMPDEKDRLGKAIKIGSIIFYIFIAVTTSWNLYLIKKQTDLTDRQKFNFQAGCWNN